MDNARKFQKALVKDIIITMPFISIPFESRKVNGNLFKGIITMYG
jgi:hypothetical protein